MRSHIARSVAQKKMRSGGISTASSSSSSLVVNAPSSPLMRRRGGGNSPEPLMMSSRRRATCGSQWPSQELTPEEAAAVSSPAKSAAAVATLEPPRVKKYTCALLFDCDGVIVETEELHRLAYNAAFKDFECVMSDGKPLVWTTEYYDILQNTVGGGKPKMKWHFKNNGWPTSKYGPPPTEAEEAARDKLIDDLQDKKTEHYKKIVDSAAEARPGIIALMDEGLARDDVAMCICSAATKAGFVKVVNSVVKPERLAKFDVILAGDDVTRKKPDPLIYNMTREKLGLPADRCVVIEDSMVGLRAAVGAGMRCIITPTNSTASADFLGEGASAVVPVLAGEGFSVTIDDIFSKNDKGEMVPDIRIPHAAR